jgi:activator of HSP90 ATPase
MAKWGEGDARWKVEDLGETGRNVNGWHWVENNALPWSTDRLTALLAGTTLVDRDGVTATLADSLTLTGDAIINQRKGKIIPAYELELTMKWKGIGADGTEVAGEIKAPYISEENHDEDPEVQVSVSSGGAAGDKVRSLVVADGRPVVHKAVAIFVAELRAGGPIAKEAAAGTAGEAAAAAPAAPKPAPAAPTPAAPAVQAKSSSSGRSIEITESFYASSADIFECFTDPNKCRAYTGAPATIEARPGGPFSLFGGSIEGTFINLEPPSHIEMDWRFSSWPDGTVSRVVIELEEETKGAVTLKLKQTGIPMEDRFGNHDVVAMTQAGWKNQVLTRMRKVFGYGA